MDIFCRNAALQRHLLAVDLPILEAAVHAGNEFVQIKCRETETRVSMRNVENQEEETTVAVMIDTTLQQLMIEIKKNTEQMNRLQAKDLTARDPSGENQFIEI